MTELRQIGNLGNASNLAFPSPYIDLCAVVVGYLHVSNSALDAVLHQVYSVGRACMGGRRGWVGVDERKDG